jgi:hypothetical protein
LEQRQKELDAKAKELVQVERNWRKRDLKQLEHEVQTTRVKAGK